MLRRAEGPGRCPGPFALSFAKRELLPLLGFVYNLSRDGRGDETRVRPPLPMAILYPAYDRYLPSPPIAPEKVPIAGLDPVGRLISYRNDQVEQQGPLLGRGRMPDGSKHPQPQLLRPPYIQC
jgi:hypothetical protein